MLNHLKTDIFILWQDEVDDRGEDDQEEAEEEKSSTERKIRFQQWVQLDWENKKYAGDCSCQALQ